MKKVFIFLFILVLLVVAGAGVFIATFNADRYRPLLTQKLSEIVGRPVDLDRISLIWKNGIAVRLEGLSVYSDNSKQFSSVKMASADAFVELAPLLQKQFQVKSVVLRAPVIYLEKSSQGQVQVKGVSLPAQVPVPSGGPQAVSETPFQFSMNSLKIEDAEVHFEDRVSQPTMELSVRHVDLDMKDFSLVNEFPVKIAAAVFSANQNVGVNARILLPVSSKAGYVRDLKLDTDLSSFSWQEIIKVVPALSTSGIEGMGGRIDVSAERVDLDPAALDSLKARVRLENGTLKLQGIKSVLQNIQLVILLNGADLTVESFSGNFAKGVLKASAVIRQFRTQPVTGLRWSSQDLAIDELTPSTTDGGAPKLGGRFSLDFEGQASGLNGPQISQTLSGQGRLLLKDGVLLNYNMLREVIQKISVIPGAEAAIKSRLPGIYQAKLSESSTILRPVELPFVIQNSQMVFNQLALDTDVLSIRGAGQVGLDKTIQARSVILLDRDLTAAIVGVVPQTQLLVNLAGQLEVPVTIQGQLPQVLVLPDTDYIGQKLLASKAQELVTGLIQDPEKSISDMKNLIQSPAEGGQQQVQDVFSKLLGEEPKKS